jgi:hypothetical protein
MITKKERKKIMGLAMECVFTAALLTMGYVFNKSIKE